MGNVLETLVPARLGSGYRWVLATSWTTNLSDGVGVAAGPLRIMAAEGERLTLQAPDGRLFHFDVTTRQLTEG